MITFKFLTKLSSEKSDGAGNKILLETIIAFI